MKISDMHADRIDAMVGLDGALTRLLGSEYEALLMISGVQELARDLVTAAPEGSDPGRLTHAIDCLRAALEALVQSADLQNAKKRRLERVSAAGPAAAADEPKQTQTS